MYKTLLASAMAGCASATIEIFLNDQSPAEVMDTELFSKGTIGNGICQTYEGYNFFDLKDLDEKDRNKAASQPAVTESEDGSAFWYKVCQSSWNFKSDYFDLMKNQDTITKGKKNEKLCEGKEGNAYYMNADAECLYSFDTSTFKAIGEKKEGEKKKVIKGFSLTYKSQQLCADDNTSKFHVIQELICKKGGEGKFAVKSTDQCSVTYEMTGEEGCWSNFGEVKKVMNIIAPFFGVFVVVGGIILTFFGKRVYTRMFSYLMFFMGIAITFGALYNFLINKNSPPYMIWVFLAVSIIVGGLAAFLTFKFTQKHMPVIVAAIAGLAVGFMIAALAKIENFYAETGIVLAMACLGWFLGSKYNKQVKYIGTAVIGAYFIVWGIGQYAPGFPSTNRVEISTETAKDPFTMAYIGGYFVLAIAGIVVQSYLFTDDGDDNNDDDFMKNEDDNKFLGCF